jgi:hypothetical protein
MKNAFQGLTQELRGGLHCLRLVDASHLTEVGGGLHVFEDMGSGFWIGKIRDTASGKERSHSGGASIACES